MTDAPTRDARHPQPVPIDLGDIETAHTDPESPEHLLSTAIAETAAAVTGVHHLGGALSRSLDRASRRILGSSTVHGVTVSQSEGTTVVDLDLVVEYPHTITTVVEQIRSQVRHAAAQLGNEPIEVNVTVTDVHGPFDKVEPVNEEIDPAESVTARASEAVDTVKTKASEAASAVAGTVSSAKDAASDALADTVAAAADEVSAAVDTPAEEIDSAPVAGHPAADTSTVDVDEASLHESPVIVVVPVVVEAENEDSDSDSDSDFEAAPAAEPTEQRS